MPRHRSTMKILALLFLAPLIWIGWAAVLRGQTAQKSGDNTDSAKPCPAQAYDQDAAGLALNTTAMSADVRQGYRLFREKCGTCHSLNQKPTKSESSAQDWTNMVYRMRDMPSSHMSDAQSKAIVTFVIWSADYSNDLVRTLMAFDRDHDGKLSKSEVPERMQSMFDGGDTNHDGQLTPEEIRKYAEAQGTAAAPASENCDPDHRKKKP